MLTIVNLALAIAAVLLSVWDVNTTVAGKKKGLTEANKAISLLQTKFPKTWVYVYPGAIAVIALLLVAIAVFPLTTGGLAAIAVYHLYTCMENNNLEKPDA